MPNQLSERGKAHVRAHDLHLLIEIGGVSIYATPNGKYVCFVSNLDVCTDGSGDHHGDTSPQDQTAYYNGGKFLNADRDRYIVIPPQVRSMVAPVVMGCQAKLTRIDSGKFSDAVTGEIGPTDKTGEAAYCLARFINPQVDANCGDDRMIYFYELWPGIPAVVGKKHYDLEPA